MNEQTHARILHKNEAHSDFVIANLNIIDREVDMWIDKCYGLSAAAWLLLHACDVRVNLCDFSLYCHHFRFFFSSYVHARARMLAKVCAKKRVWNRSQRTLLNAQPNTEFFSKSNINNNAN